MPDVPSAYVEFKEKGTSRLIVKDFRTFRRDPQQWGQVLLFTGLLVLYFGSVKRMFLRDVPWVYQNSISALNLCAIGPLGVVLGHREVRQRVLRLGALRRQARVPAGHAPDTADVRGPVEHHHVVPGLLECLRGGQARDAGPDDPDSHGQWPPGGICNSMPNFSMISFSTEMSLGPGGSSPSAW